MFTYPIYKAIKQRLTDIAPAYYYLNQYQPGKDNTSYLVPAVYIETPKNTALTFYGRKLLTAKDAAFKIHYISNAPYKNHTTGIQESAIAAHEAVIVAIDKLITGWSVRDTPQLGEPEGAGLILTQQFLPVNASLNNQIGMHLVSVITYNTQIHSRHLREV